MDFESIYEYTLGMEKAEACFPFDEDTLVFKICGKMFALMALEKGLNITLKCTPEQGLELREQYSCIKEGYHMNKKHWITIDLDAEMISPHIIKELISNSYHLVKSKTKKTR